MWGYPTTMLECVSQPLTALSSVHGVPPSADNETTLSSRMATTRTERSEGTSSTDYGRRLAFRRVSRACPDVGDALPEHPVAVASDRSHPLTRSAVVIRRRVARAVSRRPRHRRSTEAVCTTARTPRLRASPG